MSSSEEPSSDRNNNRDRDTATLLHTSSSENFENGTSNGETRVSLDDSMDDIMVELDEHNEMDDPELEEIAKDTSTLAQWLQRGYVNLKSRTKKNLKRASFHEGTKLEMSPSGFKWKKKAAPQTVRGAQHKHMSPGSPVVPRTQPPRNENFSYFKSHWRKRFAHYYFTTLFLILLGMITACLGAAVDVGIFEMIQWRNSFMELSSITFFKWVLWTSFLIASVIVCIIWTAQIAPSASGSGVPEMKTILSGMELGNSLSFRCLMTKTIGLVLSLGSGLSIGKVGPFVHIGCMVANQLARLTIFENLKKSPAVMQQMIGTGCAVGYACSLGAPIGGVLLSVEITSAYYPVRNYWFSYLGALAGAVTFRYLRNTFLTHPGLTPLVEVDFKSEIHLGLLGMDLVDGSLIALEIVIFVLLGVVAGLLGVLFIKINAFALKKWKAFTKKNNILKSPYMLAVVIGVITGTVTFPYLFGHFMSIPAFWQLQDLCRDDLTIHHNNETKLHAKDWERFPLGVSLLLSFLMRYLLTAVSVLIPVPAGLYAPILAAGSALGRTFGELVNLVTQNDTLRSILLWEGGSIVPGGYAVAGAAALAAGVTHTQSSAIVVLELTGQIYYLMPILISVVTAVAVAKKFSSLSIYDSVAKMRGLPYLPDVQQITYDIVVKDIMNPSVKYITKEFKYDHIIKLLAEADFSTYPVVDSEESMLLIGLVQRPILDAAVRDYFEKLRKLQRGLARHETVVQENPDCCPDLVFESAPIQLLPTTSLIQAHMLFITLRLTHAYVSFNGKLIGLLTRGDLKETISKKDLSLTVLRE